MLVAVALVASGAAACSSGAPPGPPPDPFAAVVAARAAYGEPAVTLVTAGEELQIVARGVRVGGLQGARLVAAVEDLEARIATLRAAAVEVAVDPLAGLPEGAEPDPAVVAAQAAWHEAVASAQAVASAGAADGELATLLSGYEERLAAAAAVWDQPGSRNQQLQRLADAAADADAVAEEAADLAQRDPPCLDAVGRRVRAAMTIAERTRELRDLVDRFRGTEFDERRAEYAADPDGIGPLAQLDAAQGGCWDASSAVAAGLADLLAAVDRLQEALSPGAR